MSQENVETVRHGYDLFNRGDMPAWLETFDSDLVYHTSEDNLDVESSTSSCG